MQSALTISSFVYFQGKEYGNRQSDVQMDIDHVGQCLKGLACLIDYSQIFLLLGAIKISLWGMTWFFVGVTKISIVPIEEINAWT